MCLQALFCFCQHSCILLVIVRVLFRSRSMVDQCVIVRSTCPLAPFHPVALVLPGPSAPECVAALPEIGAFLRGRMAGKADYNDVARMLWGVNRGRPPLDFGGDGDETVVGSEASHEQISGSVMRCSRCHAGRADLSPLDVPGATERAWGSADLCQLCTAITGIVSSAPANPLVATLGHSVQRWSVLQHAYVAMVGEGARTISGHDLLARYESFFKFLAPVLNWIPEQRAQSSIPPATLEPQELYAVFSRAADPSYATPDKRRPAGPPFSPRTPSTSPPRAESSSSTTRSPPPPQPPIVPVLARSPREVAPATAGGSGRPPLPPNQKPDDITALSINGPLNNGILGASIGRIRNTINEHTGRMRTATWFRQFKPATERALQRRLWQYESTIREARDIDLIRAYTCLQHRVQALLSSYKALEAWKMTGVENKLIEFAKHVEPIVALFEHVGWEFSGELQVVRIHAAFARVASDTGSVAQAMQAVDHAEFLGCFELLALELGEFATDADTKDEPTDDAGPLENLGPVVDDPDDGAGAIAQPSVANSSLSLVQTANPVELMARMLDKQIMYKLHCIPMDDGERQPVLQALAKDFRAVQQEWVKRFKKGEIISRIDFGGLLDSLALVFEAAAETDPVARSRSSPSALRQANEIIQYGNDMANPAFRSAQAFFCQGYDGCKGVLDVAKELAASGMQDASADLEFANVLGTLEKKLFLAFDGLEKWATTDNDGEWHDLNSYQEYLNLVRSSTNQLRMVAPQWSLARLEEQRLSVMDVFGHISTILGFASVLAIKHIIGQLGVLVEWSVLAAPMAVIEGSPLVGEGNPSSGDGPAQLVVATAQEVCQQPARERDLKAACASLGAVAESVGAFMTTVVGLFEETASAFNNFADKAGTKFVEEASESDIDIVNALKDSRENQDKMMKLCAYIDRVVKLSELEPLTLRALEGGGDKDSPYILVLSSFCALHKEMQAEQFFSFAGTTDCHYFVESLRFAPFGQGFVAQFGEKAFEKHAMPSASSAITWLEDLSAQVHAVDPGSIMDVSDASSVFHMLVGNITPQTLMNMWDLASFDEKLGQHIQSLRHCKVLDNLRSFTEAIGLASLPTSKVRPLNDDGSACQPSQPVMIYIKMVTGIKTVLVLMATLHMKLLRPIAMKQVIAKYILMEEVPYLSSYLKVELDNLDKHLHCEGVKAMESEAWQLPISFVVARCWMAAVQAFAKRVEMETLGLWVNMVETTTKKAGDATPAWSACVIGDVWNMKLAQSILVGKSTQIIKGHNELYDFLSDLNKAAMVMGVEPRLQKNPVTSDAISVALHTLATVKLAELVATGATLIATYRNSHLAYDKASSFLAKHPIDKRPASIPAAFWFQLETMASQGPVPGASRPSGEAKEDTSAKDESAAQATVKRERSQSPPRTPTASTQEVAKEADPPSRPVGLKRRRVV